MTLDEVLDALGQILDDEKCIEGFDNGERICTHDKHHGYMWPDGATQCNGAPRLLKKIRKIYFKAVLP